MENLHIPLHSHHTQTTRRTRRVVWQKVIVALGCLVLLAGYVGRVWFTRMTLDEVTPQNTVAHLHFTLNRSQWDDLENKFGQLPVISGSPITVSDLRPFTQGEFSVFLLEDGSRVLGLRAKKVDLPLNLFDSLGLTLTSVNSKLHLLSKQPVTPAPISVRKPVLFYWLALYRRPLGTVHFFGENPSAGILYSSEEKWVLKITGKQGTDEAWVAPFLQGNALAAADLSGVWDLKESVNPPPNRVAIADGGILFEFSKESSATEIEKFFEKVVKLHNTTLKETILPDASVSYEIVAGNSPSNIEKIYYQGSEISRAVVRNGTYVYLSEKDGRMAVSDSRSLIESWISNEKTENKTETCNNGFLYISFNELKEIVSNQMEFYSQILATNSFKSICAKEARMGTNIEFSNE